MSQFMLQVITPERVFFEGEVQAVIVETLMGRVEIMARHIAYVGAVVPGVLRVKTNEETKKAFVSRGLIQFQEGKALVLVDSAELPENIDVERARKARERAQQRIAARDKDIDIDRARNALIRANARLKLSDVL